MRTRKISVRGPGHTKKIVHKFKECRTMSIKIDEEIYQKFIAMIFARNLTCQSVIEDIIKLLVDDDIEFIAEKYALLKKILKYKIYKEGCVNQDKRRVYTKSDIEDIYDMIEKGEQ